MQINVKVKKNPKFVSSLRHNVDESLGQTMIVLKKDIEKEEVVPYDTGNMQDRHTLIKRYSGNIYKLVYDVDYAEKVYYHPELHFQTTHNKNAKAHWLAPWINGYKSDFVQLVFSQFLKERYK